MHAQTFGSWVHAHCDWQRRINICSLAQLCLAEIHGEWMRAIFLTKQKMREGNIFYHASSIRANRGWRRKTWRSFTDKDGEMPLTSKGNDREACGKYWFLLNIPNVFFSSIRVALLFFFLVSGSFTDELMSLSSRLIKSCPLQVRHVPSSD